VHRRRARSEKSRSHAAKPPAFAFTSTSNDEELCKAHHSNVLCAYPSFLLLRCISPTYQTHTMPGPFSSKSFANTLPNSLAARYRKQLTKHPFLLFGLPFLTTIVAGSFMLTPATALRYERYDRKNQQITHDQALGLGQNRRKVNMKDEYYVGHLQLPEKTIGTWTTGKRIELTVSQRLQAKDLEDWEQRRVKRLPGEIDGVLE
jgi:cytochrome c oxidase assembly protein subunit 16